jgi:hypothetical protein
MKACRTRFLTGCEEQMEVIAAKRRHDEEVAPSLAQDEESR